MDRDEKQIRREIEKLRRQIGHHDRCYYVLDQPEISDKQYDDLLRKLKDLESEHPKFITPDSPTQRVGGEPLKEFKNVRHRQKMLSLDNTYSFDELRSWEERVRKSLGDKKVEFVAELKIDGVSANLTYNNGVLTIGATRGDGQTGEDATFNLKTIRAIPLRLDTEEPPKSIEVRGEVYMEKKHLGVLNKQRLKNNEAPFVNPRNAAAGSLKLLDAKIVAKRHLNFFVHSLGAAEGRVCKTHWEFLKQAKSWGLRTNPHIFLCQNLAEVVDLCREWEIKREKLEYEIDGVVVKVNSLEQRGFLGATLKSPRWAVAYKFAAHQATTQLLDIIVQVGRTGVLTPVAQLKPVECGGVTISRATLHNFDEIERLDVRVGDRIVLERAGEVIPKIVKVVTSVRKGNAKKVKIPRKCPECSSGIVKEKVGEVAYRCINPSCPVQLEKGLLHFASRGAMDIEGLGESVVQDLIKRGLVTSFSGIYFLKQDDFLKLNLFKDKRAENLVKAIKDAKNRPLHRLLYGLGIRHVGEKAAYVLAQRFGTLEKIIRSQPEELSSIHEIGEVMAQSIVDFFQQAKAKQLIADLKKAGVNTTQPQIDALNNPLTGKTVVFTGEFEKFSRKEAEGLVCRSGGNASSSVSQSTDFVVAGENPGSKLRKARSLGVKVIDEKEFSKLTKER